MRHWLSAADSRAASLAKALAAQRSVDCRQRIGQGESWPTRRLVQHRRYQAPRTAACRMERWTPAENRSRAAAGLVAAALGPRHWRLAPTPERRTRQSRAPWPIESPALRWREAQFP